MVGAITVGLSIVAGVLYRLGGWSKGNRLWRLLGVPAIATIWLCYLTTHNPIYLVIQFGLLAGALSTYWDFLFGFDNFWFHGFMCGIAALPVTFATGHWLGFGIRCAVLSVFMGLWCKFWKWDIAEEFGRGASIILTLPLLLL